PASKNAFDFPEHGGGIEIADEQQHCVFRRVEVAIDALQVVALVRGNLLDRRSNLRIRMRAEEDLAQSLAREEAGLGALQLYFFPLLPPLALEFTFGEGCFASEFVDELEQWLSEFGEAGERDGAGIGAGAGAEISAESAQAFFDLAAGALRGSGA